jgi:hypothetical protein
LLSYLPPEVTAPEGGVKEGQEFEVPYPTTATSTPATVKVTAPSTLEAGFTFEAVADGKTFTGELFGCMRYLRPGRRAHIKPGAEGEANNLAQLPFFLSLALLFVPAVTVPEGGVEKGQEFEVPYPSDATGAPHGRWKVCTGTRQYFIKRCVLSR